MQLSRRLWVAAVRSPAPSAVRAGLEAPRDNGATLPGGGYLQLFEPLFEHEASPEEVTEMLQRGLSSEFFDQIMEFALRLPEDDDIGDILERIYDQAVAALEC